MRISTQLISYRVVSSRAQIHSVEHDDDKSKSNFSLRGATLQDPISKQRPGSGRLGSTVPSEYSGESWTNARFGHRLASADSSGRPSSGRTVTPSRPNPAPSDEGHSISVTVTRPVWDESTHAPVTSVQSTIQSRNTSQNRAATRTITAPLKKIVPHRRMAGDLSPNIH